MQQLLQPVSIFVSMFGVAIVVAACDPQAKSTTPPEVAPAEPVAEAAPAEPVAEVAPESAPSEARAAEARLTPAQGSAIGGTIVLAEVEGGLEVKGTISGLRPGVHGFHIHETGDCSAADFASAGSHWNPTGMPHGGPGAPQHHLGDLGNIEAGADGVAQVDVTVHGLSLDEGGGASPIGKSVIVHQDADDLSSQPSGAAGARLACGVIAAVG